MARTDITAERLRELLNYDPETGIFTWKNPASNRCKVGSAAGSANDLGYIGITIDWIKYKAHRLAWLYVYGEHPKLEIDHINGVRGDNRISNLREVDRSQNMLNQRLENPASRSGLTGVSQRGDMFTTMVRMGKTTIRLGLFETAAEASESYNAVRQLAIEYISLTRQTPG